MKYLLQAIGFGIVFAVISGLDKPTVQSASCTHKVSMSYYLEWKLVHRDTVIQKGIVSEGRKKIICEDHDQNFYYDQMWIDTVQDCSGNLKAF